MELKDFVKITEQPHFKYGKDSQWEENDDPSELPLEIIDKYNKPGMNALERFQLAMQAMPTDISNPIDTNQTIVVHS